MAASSGPDIVEDGLVLYLDAANPRSYPGSGTVWNDMSGNGNHASLTGTYQYVANNSFLFNSGSQLDGDGRATVDFGTVSSSSNYTVECIFKINRYMFLSGTSNIAAQIFSSGRTSGNFDEAFYLARNGVSGEVQNAGLAWYDAGGADGPGGNKHNYIFVDNVYSAVVTVTVPGVIKFYINGEFSVSDTNNATDLRLDNTWSVANQPPGTNNGVDSNFYIVRAYNRILSDSEIRQNFEATRARYGI